MAVVDGSTTAREKRAHGGNNHLTGAHGAWLIPVGALTAVRRHPLLVLIPALLLAGAGIAVGMLRKPVYTATNRMTLQITSNEASGMGNATEAAVAQAATYSRAITANDVVIPAARSLHETAGEVASQVTATPVGQSPDFTVSATAKSSGVAVRAANATTDALASYVSRVSHQGDPAAALAQYQNAITAYEQQVARADQTAQQSGSGSQATKDAQAAAEAAALQRDTLKQKYETTELAPASTVIVLQRATSATSDRRSKIELLALLGLVAGVLAGTVLALLSANRSLLARRAAD